MKRINKNTLSSFLTRIERIIGLPKPAVTVLAYHAVSNDKTIVDITPETFQRQMAFLKERFAFIALDEVIDFIKGKKKCSKPAVALTFDDGYMDVFEKVFPILKKEKIPAAVFAMSDPMHANREELANKKALMSKKELSLLHKNGWTIGCHSSTHASFAGHAVDRKKEIQNAKKQLEHALGVPVTYFAYPKGDYSQSIAESVKKTGFAAAFSFESGFISRKSNLFTIPRMPVDHTHSMEQFEAFFTYWGKTYLKMRYGIEKI